MTDNEDYFLLDTFTTRMRSVFFRLRPGRICWICGVTAAKWVGGKNINVTIDITDVHTAVDAELPGPFSQILRQYAVVTHGFIEGSRKHKSFTCGLCGIAEKILALRLLRRTNKMLDTSRSYVAHCLAYETFTETASNFPSSHWSYFWWADLRSAVEKESQWFK